MRCNSNPNLTRRGKTEEEVREGKGACGRGGEEGMEGYG